MKRHVLREDEARAESALTDRKTAPFYRQEKKESVANSFFVFNLNFQLRFFFVLLQQSQEQASYNRTYEQRHEIHEYVTYYREYEDAAVRCHECALERHRECTGNSGTYHQSRDNMQRVCSCVRDSTLCDEAESHDEVDRA